MEKKNIKYVYGTEDGWYSGSPLRVFNAFGEKINLMAEYHGYSFKRNTTPSKCRDNKILFLSTVKEIREKCSNGYLTYQVEVGPRGNIVKWLKKNP